MGPEQRQDLALQALAGTETISRLAAQHEVSRKFIYQQAARAERGPPGGVLRRGSRRRTEVLFYLPVTKAWLRAS